MVAEYLTFVADQLNDRLRWQPAQLAGDRGRDRRRVYPERFPSVTVMATGASAVGLVHPREAGAVMTDGVRPKAGGRGL